MPGPVKKECVPLLIQALDAYTQIKFQSYYCPLIIARDFGTLFLWVVQEGVLCERCVACLSAGNDYRLAWEGLGIFLTGRLGVHPITMPKFCAVGSTLIGNHPEAAWEMAKRKADLWTMGICNTSVSNYH